MDFYVYDKELNRVDIIDGYTSVIWTLKHNDYGDFQLTIKSTPEILELCKPGYFVVRSTDKTAMIIKSVAQAESTQNGDYITIKGVSVESILTQRVVWEYTALTGRVEECIYNLVLTNCIAPSNENRIIPKLRLSPLKHLLSEIPETKYTGTNVFEAVKLLCTNAGYGFRITIRNGEFIFEVYESKDRTRNQTVNPRVVFDAENISENTLLNDISQFKNVALVGGSGEGVGRVYSSYGDASGLDRYETFVEDTSVDSKSLLSSTGRDKLQETNPIRTFDGEISNYYSYGVDYNLGDKVSIETKTGIHATARIIEMIQSIDNSGIYTIPTFSEWEV